MRRAISTRNVAELKQFEWTGAPDRPTWTKDLGNGMSVYVTIAMGPSPTARIGVSYRSDIPGDDGGRLEFDPETGDFDSIGMGPLGVVVERAIDVWKDRE